MLYLASSLKAAGNKVNILDLKAVKVDKSATKSKYYENVLIDRIRNFRPDLIGTGCLFSGNFPDALYYSKILKNNYLSK